jgi:ribosomal protein S11
MKHYYAVGQWEIYGKVLIGSSSGGVGFYGTAPISKQTVAAAATDAATTMALANDLRAKLVSLGLLT